MRSGQRKARRKRPFYKNVQKRFSPHQYLEDEIVRLETLEDASRRLWGDFQKYLANEREKVLEQIKNGLLETSTHNFFQKHLSRIINLEYSNNPLSSKGSYLKPPGGRFNIGQSISYTNYFPALYLANEYDVAFHEKFHSKSDTEGNEDHALGFSLRKPKSFAHLRFNVSLTKVIE